MFVTLLVFQLLRELRSLRLVHQENIDDMFVTLLVFQLLRGLTSLIPVL